MTSYLFCHPTAGSHRLCSDAHRIVQPKPALLTIGGQCWRGNAALIRYVGCSVHSVSAQVGHGRGLRMPPHQTPWAGDRHGDSSPEEEWTSCLHQDSSAQWPQVGDCRGLLLLWNMEQCSSQYAHIYSLLCTVIMPNRATIIQCTTCQTHWGRLLYAALYKPHK